MAQDIINENKKRKKECRKYNISFIDTSHNRKEVLENVLEQLEQTIK